MNTVTNQDPRGLDYTNEQNLAKTRAEIARLDYKTTKWLMDNDTEQDVIHVLTDMTSHDIPETVDSDVVTTVGNNNAWLENIKLATINNSADGKERIITVRKERASRRQRPINARNRALKQEKKALAKNERQLALRAEWEKRQL